MIFVNKGVATPDRKQLLNFGSIHPGLQRLPVGRICFGSVCHKVEPMESDAADYVYRNVPFKTARRLPHSAM